MLVSVIIPNYNHSKYLKDRIDSVLNQSYFNFEVIILDDCSTDSSREIIENYRSNPKIVHIEYNEINSGSTFKQWHKGLDLAKGEWIWIAESDDVSDGKFLEILLANSENSELIFCNSLIIDENSDQIKLYGFDNMPCKSSFPQFRSDFNITGKDYVEKWMTSDNFIPNASAVIFRKDLLIKTLKNKDIFQDITKMKLMGDWYFWIILSSYSKNLTYVQQSLNQFRNHSQNVRSRTLKNSLTELKFILSLLLELKINRDKTISTYLFRLFDRNKNTHFSYFEKLSIIADSIKFNFFLLLMKSWLKIKITR
jgi:glycosyltransferase involved in cell wall biosynthesis